MLGDDWFCDECQQAVQSSKANSDGLADAMDEPADAADAASPCNAPCSDALAGAALRAEEGRAALGSPAGGGMAGTAGRPDTDKKGVRADGSSPDGTSPTEDIELDLSPTASSAVQSSSKKSKKVDISASLGNSGSHLHSVTQMLQSCVQR